MGRRQGQGLVQGCLPEGGGEPRQAGDEIQAPAAQPFGVQQRHGGLNLPAVVASPYGRQEPVVKALGPKTDAVHTCPVVAPQALGTNILRVQFHGDLCAWRQTKPGIQQGQQPSHLGGVQQGGGAAAKINSGERRSRRATADFLPQPSQVLGHGAGRGPIRPIPQGNNGKITVKTTAMTKGKMYIGAAGR